MADRPEVKRRDALKLLAAAVPTLMIFRCAPPASAQGKDGDDAYDINKHYWAYAVDTTKCIGCCACMRACRAENNVPPKVERTWVERYRVTRDGKVAVDAAKGPDYTFSPVEGEVEKAFFVPKICNHCEKSVCHQVCPVGASYMTKDGVVLVDKDHCVGCGYCVQACPYGSRFISPVNHIADKCTLCYHRITKGLLPACVQSCPKGARIFGDLKDPKSSLSVLLRQRRYRLLRPELGTHPKCYYLGLDAEVV